MNTQNSFKIPDGFMMDASGALIPIDNIKPIDIYEDSVVKEIIKQVEEAQGVLKETKSYMDNTFDRFVEQSVNEYDAKRPGGVKGNITLLSFDGAFKIIKQVQEHIALGPEIHAAKVLIDECFTEWMSAGVDNNLRTVIESAFKVNKEGQLNTNAILSLRQHKINHPKWLKAMEAISDSVKVVNSKSYFRAYKRLDDGEYEAIPLDIAAL